MQKGFFSSVFRDSLYIYHLHFLVKHTFSSLLWFLCAVEIETLIYLAACRIFLRYFHIDKVFFLMYLKKLTLMFDIMFARKMTPLIKLIADQLVFYQYYRKFLNAVCTIKVIVTWTLCYP